MQMSIANNLTVASSFVNRKGVIFQHDSVRPHASKQTKEKIRSLGWGVLSYPPYSPDLAPTDFYLFRSLEHFIGGKTLKNREEVKASLSEEGEEEENRFLRTRHQKVTFPLGCSH